MFDDLIKEVERMNNEIGIDQIRFVNHLNSRSYKRLVISSEIVIGENHYFTFPIGLSRGLMFVYEQLKLNLGITK